MPTIRNILLMALTVIVISGVASAGSGRVDSSGYRLALAAALASPDSPRGAISRDVADAFAAALPTRLIQEEFEFAGGDPSEAIGWNIHFDSMPAPWDTARQVWAFYTTTHTRGLVMILERQGKTVRFCSQKGALESLMMPVVRVSGGDKIGIDGSVVTVLGFWSRKMNLGAEILSWDGAQCDLLSPCEDSQAERPCSGLLMGREWRYENFSGDGMLELVVDPADWEVRELGKQADKPVAVFRYDKARHAFVRIPVDVPPLTK